MFWELNPKYLNIYAKEYEHKSKEELEQLHQTAWLNGYQVFAAAVSILNKKPYPQYASPLKDESSARIEGNQDNNDSEAKKMAAGFAAFVANNEAFKKLPKSNE